MRRTSESRAQSFVFDFMFGIFVFVLAWAFISSQFSARLADTGNSSDLQSMRLMADYTLESMVKTSGTPKDWEKRTVSDLNSVGLAASDRRIDEGKLAALSNFSSSYESLRSRMGVGYYDFYFDFAGTDHVTAGLQPQGSADEVIAKRIVDYKGGVAVATLTLYRLRR